MPEQVVENHDADALTPEGLGEVETRPSAPSGTEGAIEFVSRSASLRLVYRPAREKRDNWGNIIDKQVEQTVEFANGRYLAFPADDDRGRFEDGKSVLEWLRSHPSLDKEFAGFVEITPVVPPPSSDLLGEITVAAITRNEEALLRMWDEESSGYGRDEVLAPVRQALDALQALREAEESGS